MSKDRAILDTEASSQNAIRDGTITDLEAAKLLLDSWKFRQAHAWSSLTRYFFAAVFVSVLPYILKNELVSKLKDFLLVLPIIGGLIALAAIWLYAAEYVRAQSLNRQFRSILKNYQQYQKIDLRRIEKIVLAPRIGWTTVYLLTVATIVLASTNIFIVWSLIRITT